MGLRLNAMQMLGVACVTCTRPEEFTWSLRRIGVPATMTLALSLTFRLVPMFAGTAHTITQAQTARGLDFRSGGLLTRLGRYIPLMVPVLAIAYAATCVWLRVSGYGEIVGRL